MLVHRRKLIEYLLLDQIRRYNNHIMLLLLLGLHLLLLFHGLTHLLKEHLVVFLEPDVLKELCEGHTESEGVFYSLLFSLEPVGFVKEVVSDLVNGQKAL